MISLICIAYRLLYSLMSISYLCGDVQPEVNRDGAPVSQKKKKCALEFKIACVARYVRVESGTKCKTKKTLPTVKENSTDHMCFICKGKCRTLFTLDVQLSE